MDALSLLGSANRNAAPQGALDALSAFSQSGPKMPDFSGAQFGGVNNLGAASATNPFSMSGAAGAAASKLPQMGGPGGGAGGGMAGLSGSINKLIASNNKLIAALNKLSGSMGGSKAMGAGFGIGSMSRGAQGGDPMGIFEQLNLQKRPGVGGGGTPGGGAAPEDPGGGGGGAGDGGAPKSGGGGFLSNMLMIGGGSLLKNGITVDLGMLGKHKIDPISYLPKNMQKPMRDAAGLVAHMGKYNMGLSSIGQGTSIEGIYSNLPYGLGAATAQNYSVLQGRLKEMASIERLAFRTNASIGTTTGPAGMAAAANISGIAAQYGYTPEMAMENVLDVYTTGGFRPGKIGGTGRDALEKSFSVEDIFRFKNVGYGSTVMGGIQELQMRGSGARGLIGGDINNIAYFGAGNKLGARGMNVLTESMRNLGQQANMFGMEGGRQRLFEEAIGFENLKGTPKSFQGFQNALNRSFMTHQQLFEGTGGKIQGMFGDISANLGFAMDVRAAKSSLGPGASGMAIMREANRLSRTTTAQQKVIQMRADGLSDDAILARLMGAGLDDDQITFALSDTAGTGAKRITEDIKGAIKDVGKKGPGGRMPITSKQAAQKFKEVKENYDNVSKFTELVGANNALRDQLFENAKALSINTAAITGLSAFFEGTSGDLTTTMNELIKFIKDANIKTGSAPLPSL